MTPRGRVTLAILITIALVSAMLAMIVTRTRYWNRTGMSGLTYIPVQTVKGKPAPQPFGINPSEVMIVFPDGPAEKSGIRFRDEIRAINGIPLTDHARLRQLNTRVKSGDVVVYTIQRGKQKLNVPIRFGPIFPNRYSMVTVSVTAFVAAAFLAIGLLVFSRRPDDRRAVVFFVMVLMGALSLMGTILAGTDATQFRGISPDPQFNVAALIMVIFFTFAFTPLTLHLSLVFPADRPVLVRHPYLLRWVYGIPVAAILLASFYIVLIAAVQSGSPSNEELVERILNIGSATLGIVGLFMAWRIARRAREEGLRRAFVSRPVQTLLAILAAFITLTRIFGALRIKPVAVTLGFLTAFLPFLAVASYPVLVCINLYRSYRDSGVEQRRQVKWPLWGTLIAIATKVVFFVVNNALMLTLMFRGVDLTRWFPLMIFGQIIPIVGYLLIPISFAVAILKYRLMNIDVIIKKTVVYAILSGAIVVLYLVLVGGFGTILVNVAGVKNQTMVIASTLVVALVFIPLRNKLQQLVEKNLFRQKYDYPQALRAIATETLGAVDLPAFLTSSAEKLQQALQNRAVVIFIRRGDELVASAKIGLSDSVLGALTLGAPTANGFERPLDPRRRPLPDADAAALRRVEAALVVPIRSHGALHGLITLAPKLSDQEFDLEDIEFVSAAANQIAIAVDRIRVQHDEADFEQARRLQQALLPAEAPHVEGLDVSGVWQPARAVGGDYYDLMKLSETQLAVCIGDVAGKGMPAALLMSSLQGAVRASAIENVSPSEVCERVRRVVVPSLGSRFVTFFYGSIDTSAGRVRYCNAGHNPPVLVRADGSVVRLDAGGPVFSRLFRAAALTNGELDLREGDRLVLFTDGVSEARDASESDFGEHRLEELVVSKRTLGARDLAAAITSTVLSFSGGRADDDLTLVVVAVE